MRRADTALSSKCIYMARGADGISKVGMSNNPHVRASQIYQRGKLKVVFVSEMKDNAAEVEAVVHWLLDQDGKHVSGEWFRLSVRHMKNTMRRAEAMIASGEADGITSSIRKKRMDRAFRAGGTLDLELYQLRAAEVLHQIDELRVLMWETGIPSRAQYLRILVAQEYARKLDAVAAENKMRDWMGDYIDGEARGMDE